MAIPSVETMLFPFLQRLGEKDATRKDMIEFIVKHFNLTEAEQHEPTRGGSTTKLKDRIGWTHQWLRRALFLEDPERSTYSITERGREYLKTHISLNQQDLLAYPEFATYAGKATTEQKKQSSVEVEELTPTEKFEQAYKDIQSALEAELLQSLLSCKPKFFEHVVVDLLKAMGYGGAFAGSAQVTQYSHDGGIDGIISEDKLGLDKIYVQAKLYDPEKSTVGKPDIHQFSGALDEKRATKGVFITTSTFTKEAKAFVEKSSRKIVLIDGTDLTRYMIEYNVGVSTKQVYAIKKIDFDYFEE